MVFLTQDFNNSAVSSGTDDFCICSGSRANRKRSAGANKRYCTCPLARFSLFQFRGRFDRDFLIRGRGAQNFVGKTVLDTFAAIIVESKDLIVRVTKLGHIHRAALGHAHAVPVPSGLQNKGSVPLFYAPQFVLRGLNTKPKHGFKLCKNPAGFRKRNQRCLPGSILGGNGKREIHFRIQPAGRCIHRAVRRNAFERFQRGVVRRGRIAGTLQRCNRLGFQKLNQPGWIAAFRQIFINGFLFDGGRWIGIIKRIILHLHIGIGRTRAGSFRLAAVAGGIIGGDILRAIHQHDALGRIHRCNAVGVAGWRSAIHLIAGCILDVIAAGSSFFHHSDGIGTRSNRLRFQCFQAGRIAHFIRQYTVEIVFNVNMSNNIQRINTVAVYGFKRQIARVRVLTVARLRNQNSI